MTYTEALEEIMKKAGNTHYGAVSLRKDVARVAVMHQVSLEQVQLDLAALYVKQMEDVHTSYPTKAKPVIVTKPYNPR